jgi:hypothetical protein
MFKRLFVVVLFIVLSVTILPEVAKADTYEYENINELADSVASVINKKNTCTFKYKYNSSDISLDFDATVNWKNKTVSFNGFMFRAEAYYKREKFSAVLNLKNNKVNTVSKAYKKGKNMLSSLISEWSFEDGSEYRKSLGHYIIKLLGIMSKDTELSVSGDKIIVTHAKEINSVIYYSKITINKSSVLDIEFYDSFDLMKVKMK